MGRAKEAWLEEQERGYAHVDGAICANCVYDEFLKKWVSNNADGNECSFCGDVSEVPIAASFDDFIGVVMVGIAFDWNDPDNEGISYVSAEGGYQAETTNIYDLLMGGEIEDISEQQDVIEAILDAIGYDKIFVSRDFYIGTEEESYTWAWEGFRDFVINKRRYLFAYAEDTDEDVHGYREINPSEFLFELGKLITKKLDDVSVKSISTATEIFRIRIDPQAHQTAAEIGAPDHQFAKQSNRMSPAGIPMFYGAFDYATAHAETFDPLVHQGQVLSCGIFKPLRDLRVLDLANLPFPPSVFDEENHSIIRPLRFLHAFSNDIAKPIARDGREHIEYVPTQIVTEFFRHIFRTAEKEKLDGIVYKSSKENGTTACVLFCENDQAIDLNDKAEKQHLLRMMSVSHT